MNTEFDYCLITPVGDITTITLLAPSVGALSLVLKITTLLKPLITSGAVYNQVTRSDSNNGLYFTPNEVLEGREPVEMTGEDVLNLLCSIDNLDALEVLKALTRIIIRHDLLLVEDKPDSSILESLSLNDYTECLGRYLNVFILPLLAWDDLGSLHYSLIGLMYTSKGGLTYESLKTTPLAELSYWFKAANKFQKELNHTMKIKGERR